MHLPHHPRMEYGTPMKPVLVSKSDAAALLGVSLRTVDNLIACRSLPVVKIGRRRLILYSSLEELVKGQHMAVRRKGMSTRCGND
jgi:excisionase family DNA binding protein